VSGIDDDPPAGFTTTLLRRGRRRWPCRSTPLLRRGFAHCPGRGSRRRSGPTPDDLDLDRVWRAYLRRFDIEHTIKFAKQTLGWTTPKIRTPQQADRWTWLILAALTQLRLARNHVADHRLPWQPPQPTTKMTPGRVRAGFAHLLPRLGTPASWPKPSRPGPGRPKGRNQHPHPDTQH
jgi:hypothetical protein